MKTTVKINRILFFLFFSLFFLNTSCSEDPKDSSESNPEIIYGNSLSEEDNDFLESISAENPSSDQITGLNGNISDRNSGIQSLVSNLIRKMLLDAQGLSAQKLFINYPSEGDKAPQHMGFVYRYGSRDLSKRGFAKGGNKIHNSYSVLGTDCSGLMIILLKGAGIDIADTAAKDFEERLRSALKTNSIYKTLELKNIGYQTFDKIKNGDFIIWLADPKREHIGIVADLGAQGKIVYQSNGRSTPETEAEQKRNYVLGRGVHPIILNETTKNYYWGTEYKILRLIDPSSGDPSGDPSGGPLVGQDGDPRFNLQFTNSENVDLDLFVKTPSGAIIYYDNLTADFGKLDVDCLCDDCPQGPNENVFWEIGSAPSGTYQYWVEYFEACGTSGGSSNFTLRVTRNGVVLETKTGTLSGEGQKSPIWTFQQ